MSDETVSPAVKSLLAEQADQSAANKTRLEKGLEDTFPASDPVSATHTATATAPAVPEILGLHPMRETPDGLAELHGRELASLQRDVVALREKIASTKRAVGVSVPRVSNLLVAATLLGLSVVLWRRVDAI